MPASTLVAVLLLVQPASPPSVDVEDLGENTYRLTVTVEGATNPAIAQAMLQPTMTRLCGSDPYVLGRYSFNSEEAVTPAPGSPHLDRVTLVQDMACGLAESAPSPAPPATTPLTQTNLEHLNPLVEALTDRYFSAIEEARHADSLAMTSEEMTGGASLADWSRAREQRRVETGAPVSRQIARLTWYIDPADVPSGLYAAVDYVASWERQDECGYLIWFSPDGTTPFTLARQEQTFLGHGLDEDTRAAMRQRFCALL